MWTYWAVIWLTGLYGISVVQLFSVNCPSFFNFFFFLQLCTYVNMRTSFQQWRSTLCWPFAPPPTGHSAHAHRPSSNWNPWRVWSLTSGSSTRTWPWRSSSSTHRRTAAWWSAKDHQRGEGPDKFRSNSVFQAAAWSANSFIVFFSIPLKKRKLLGGFVSSLIPCTDI